MEIDHEIGPYFAEQDHRSGADDVERNLGCRAGLQSGRAGEDFGADRERNHEINSIVATVLWTVLLTGHRSVARSGVAREQDRFRADRLCAGQGSHHKRRVAARGYTDNNIGLLYAMLHNRKPADILLVFRAFGAAIERSLPASDDSLHQLRRSAEGRRDFAGIEHPEPTARPRADIKQAAASA